jgi:hypothetical protein
MINMAGSPSRPPEDRPSSDRAPSADPREQDLGQGGERCRLCGAPTIEVHCKIVSTRCGFRRDCSDP